MQSSLTRTHSARRYGWWVAAPVLVVLTIAVAWTARAPILRCMAELWVVSDSLDHADAIVVLGGRMDVRPFAAVDLYKHGFAPRILISNVLRDPLAAMQLWPGQTEVTRQMLLKLGVPAEAIVKFGDGVSSTYEEARAVLDWAKSSGARTVLIPSELFATRRVRWTFQHEAASTGIRIIVHSIAPRGYNVANWWRDEGGLIDFLNEVIKYFYYRVTY
jgi:uncharacterized SAM-binding protein YcdF (DUF218 family)